MSNTLRLREVGFVPARTTTTSASLGHWDIEVNNGSESTRMELRDPSSTLSSQVLTGLGPEETIAWYLDDYHKTPFETTKRDTAASLLTSYGRHLASQIATGDLVPKRGHHLHLQIVTPRQTEKSPEPLGPSLQHLHWEILEDVSVWPRGFAFTRVSVVRSLDNPGRRTSNPPLDRPLSSVNLGRYLPDLAGALWQRSKWHGVQPVSDADLALQNYLARRGLITNSEDPANQKTPSAAGTTPPATDKIFRILLVICRPNPLREVEYQLVAKSLVPIVDHLSRTRPAECKTTLHILRPPTWKAFEDRLRDAPHGYYDLVHFDTKGEIRSGADGSPTASLEFCKPSPTRSNPLRMGTGKNSGWVPATAVCEALVQAGVRTVVLNACDSASFRASAPGTNLAELLLSRGIQSVLAMAYKVNEEAVEIFMGVFYRSLLVDRASVEEATYRARLALLRNRSRRAPLMLRVELADHIVPVLYSSRLSYNNGVAAEPEPSEDGQGTADSRPSLLGRAYDLLMLETRLSVFSKVLLHGQGGVGKTELLQYACRFWKSTGWIQGAAYIDFDQQRPYPHKSMAEIAKSIASQLRFGPGDWSERAVLEKLRAGRYLVVFDSAEVFEADESMAYDNTRGNCSEDLRSGLAKFIDEATKNRSMVILASRLDTTTLADLPSCHHKHLLTGLSVVSSVRLLQGLAFKPGQEIPSVLERRDNIDMLRRAVILVQGNPVALRLLVPELKLANYDCEALFSKLMYGVCTTLQSPRLSGISRFERSLFLAYEREPYPITNLASFWNIMPKDLTMYHCFWSTSDDFDLEPEDWISEDMCRTAAAVARLLSDFVWPDAERRLIQGGILSHATIRKTTGDMACYHVHPVFTLHSRARLSEEGWGRARFAFVRAARLWYSHDTVPHAPDWTHVEWDSCQQHEDHLHNWRVMALAWCVQDGSALTEILCNRQPVFRYIYHLGAGIVPETPRYSRLLVPHLRSYLLELYSLVELLLPDQVPPDLVLSLILVLSHDLWKIESDVLKLPHTARAETIDMALAVFALWKEEAPSREGSRTLPLAIELSHQQLLYAAAVTVQESGDTELAKTRYEAHLATNPPAATMATNAAAAHIIRWWQFCSLQGWAACVTMIAMRHGNLERLMREEYRKVADVLGLRKEKAKPGQLMEKLTDGMKEATGEELAAVAGLRIRDEFAFALETEPDAVQRFGCVARALLDEPMWAFAGNLISMARAPEVATGGMGSAAGRGVAGPAGNETSASDGAQGPLTVEKTMELLSAGAGKGNKRPHGPSARIVAQFDAMWRMFGGDTAGAEAVLRPELKNEALSSTTSTGAEQLADVYMIMYTLAVKEATEPDYNKGLALLLESRKLRPLEQLSARHQCLVLADFATCYHGLGRIEEAARTAIDLARVAESLNPADCPGGDVEASLRRVYATLFSCEHLHLFLHPEVVVSGSRRAPGLTVAERDQMRRIMTEAKRRWVESCQGRPAFEEMMKVLDLLVAMVQ